VLLLEPAGADAAHRPAAGEDVERRDDASQVRHVAVGDARDERTEPRPRRASREEAECRHRLRQVLPRPADLRDLADVVHQPDRLETGLLRLGRDLPEPVAQRRAAAGPVEPRDAQPEPEPAAVARSGRVRRCRRSGSRRGNNAVHLREALAGEHLARRSELP
jgi:hypothetical protein